MATLDDLSQRLARDAHERAGVEYRYNPLQKRARDGKWTDGGFTAPRKGRAPKLQGKSAEEAGSKRRAALAQLKSVEAELKRKQLLYEKATSQQAKAILGDEMRRLRKRRSALLKAAGEKPDLRVREGASEKRSRMKPDWNSPKVYEQE